VTFWWVIAGSLVGAMQPEIAGVERAGGPLRIATSVVRQAQKSAAAKPKKQKKAKRSEDGVEPPPPPDAPLDPEEEAQRPAPAQPDRFVWKQHPSIRYGKKFRLDFTARLQEDGRSSYEGAELTAGLDNWELHRNRIGVQGILFRHIQFEVERELTEKELTERDITAGLASRSQWKDVYVNVDVVNNAQIQVGRFKVPFGHDELIGVTHNDFVYRSLGAMYLAPARDIGGMIHGRFFKRGLSYWTGAFMHDGDNARSKKIEGGEATWAGRVTAKPLRLFPVRGADTLELGSAVALTRVRDDSFRPNGLRGRTVLTQDTFFEPVYVKGQRRRWEGDVDWTVGPASLRAEYTRVLDERENQGLGDETLPDARYRSWYVAGTWILTGERKARPVRPAEDFITDGVGAIELAARVERIWFDSINAGNEAFANPRAETILPSGERAITLGVNWTLNRFVKLQFNAIREHLEDAERSPVAGRDAFWSRVVRLQLVL
jgi:phosphate-selective porin OprO/OprP